MAERLFRHETRHLRQIETVYIGQNTNAHVGESDETKRRRNVRLHHPVKPIDIGRAIFRAPVDTDDLLFHRVALTVAGQAIKRSHLEMRKQDWELGAPFSHDVSLIAAVPFVQPTSSGSFKSSTLSKNDYQTHTGHAHLCNERSKRKRLARDLVATVDAGCSYPVSHLKNTVCHFKGQRDERLN